MKLQFVALAAAAVLAVGCAETRQNMGGTAQNDQNVLTGGPITGTAINDLPQPVQRTLQQRAPHAEVADIDKTVRDGQDVYEISFSESGRNPKLYIKADGSVLAHPDQPSETQPR